MKVLYLIDSGKYKYHRDLIGEFLDVTGGDVLDIPDDGTRQMKFFDVKDAGADVIITFDGTGLDFRTVSDTLSLNNLYARMAHILFHRPSFYDKTLFRLENLSMFMYIPAEEDTKDLGGKYPDLPNIRNMGKFYYKAGNESERETNKESIKRWWDDFRKEAMI